MDNLTFMQVSETRYELPSNVLYPVYDIRPPLLFEVHIHVLTLHQLHYNVKLPCLIWSIVLFHEIFVLNYLRVYQILSDTELTIHLLETTVCELLIIVDLAELIYKFSPELLYFDLEYLSLGSTPELLLHCYVEVIKWLF